MSNISNISSMLTDTLLLGLTDKSTTERYEEIRQKIQNIKELSTSALTPQVVQDLRDGKYEITLREFTNFNTYNNIMSNLYGDSSADTFQSLLNVLSGKNGNNLTKGIANAKTLVEILKERGMTNKNALKTYSALQKYSLMSSLQNNYSFVSAKV